MNRYWPFINPYDEPAADIPLLREAFADWKIGGGIFTALEELNVGLPWQGSVDSTTLDIEYFGNHSGAKFSAPVVMNLLGQTQELLDSDREILAKIIVAKFKEPWSHLWATNVAAYNPIHNYDMTDVRTLIREDTEKSDDTRNTVDSTEFENTGANNEYVYGLNSDQDGPGRRDTRTDSTEGGENTSVGVSTGEANRKKNMDEVETTARSGNIGVTTTQAMLESERNLWMWNFFDQVYKDVDSVLALVFYDVCRV